LLSETARLDGSRIERTAATVSRIDDVRIRVADPEGKDGRRRAQAAITNSRTPGHTVALLRALLKGQEPPKDAHCILMYSYVMNIEIVAEAQATFGGVLSGRGIQNKEKALWHQSRANRSAVGMRTFEYKIGGERRTPPRPHVPTLIVTAQVWRF